MKNFFYYSCIVISTLLFGCGKAVIIEAGINSETKSYIFTYNANKPLKATNTAYIIDMPEIRALKVDHGTTITEPTTKPKLEGYDFQGWFMDIETKRKYEFTTPIAKDMKLYAKWTIKKFNLTFNPNKPTSVGNTIAVTGMPNPSSFSINHGTTITAPTPAPELIKYDFEGWYTEKETIHKFIFTTKITQETQLYAKWVTKTYKVAFYPNKPPTAGNIITVTGMPRPSTIRVNHEAFVSEPTTAPALIDYNFQGWYTDAATTQPYTFTTPVVQDTQLYAKWSVAINFTFNANKPSQVGDSIEVTNMPEPSTLKISRWTRITEPSTKPVLLNYVFNGWYTQEEGGNVYNFDNPVYKTTTLYAQWGFRPETKEALVQEINRKIAADGNSPNLNYIDTSLISDMSELFRYKSFFNGNISNWNVENVTNMKGMFNQATMFNQDISSWNTHLVRNMSRLFSHASAFNQDIGNWNTSNVVDMTSMFNNAIVFNHYIGSWDTSRVYSMRFMFTEASAFNQDLNNWNTHKVSNMENMFSSATAFNQNISNWDTSNVVYMSGMFFKASAFNQEIGNWNTHKVIDMSDIFYKATAFNQEIGNWNTHNVTDMSDIFYKATAFNQDLNNWNTHKVTDMSYMFTDAYAFNQDLNNWNTHNVTTMRWMFKAANTFNGNISNWDVRKVKDMTYMFSNATVFNGNISNWRPTALSFMSGMFRLAPAFIQDLESWNISPRVSKVDAFKGSGLDIDPNLLPPSWAR